MYKIENLEYKEKKLNIQGYYTNEDYKIEIYQGKNLLLSEKPNLVRPDIQAFYPNYRQGINYGFSFKIKCPKPRFKIYLTTKDKKVKIYETNNYFLRKRLSNIKKILIYMKHSLGILWKDYHFLVPLSKWKEFINIFYHKVIKRDLLTSHYYNPFSVDEYNLWLAENEQQSSLKELSYRPLISILIPVYNVEKKLLEECLNSVLEQSYPNFEICIADDCSTKQETLETLKKYEQQYSEQIKITYRKKNGHISEASNSALEIATGEFIGLLDNDDILAKNALYEVVKKLNEDKKLDMIYTDEDKINLEGRRCDPHFKPDFSKDTLYSHNYICHFTVLRTKIVREIKGFRKGYEGSQDYDLFLRFVEQTDKIAHIPKILYHWRMIPGSTSMEVSNKSYAVQSGIKSLEDMLQRKKVKGSVENYYTSYILTYDISNNPLVSIIIPTRDRVEILENCITSIIQKTTYKNYEIIIVDNGSKEEKTKEYFEKISKKYKNIRIQREDVPFNYSYLNNIGAKVANGEYLVLLNNDIEIITERWLDIMLGYASQKHIGAVGPKLLFANGKIQHAGVVTGVGVGHIANHAFYLEDKNAIAPAGRLIVPYNYSAVTGACIMISKKKFESVKGLEEKLAVNYNDIDFCLKLLDKNYYNIVLPQVELYHLDSVSRGKILDEKKQKQYEQERDYMKKKWKEKLEQDPFYNPNYSLHQCFKLDKKGEEYE